MKYSEIWKVVARVTILVLCICMSIFAGTLSYFKHLDHISTLWGFISGACFIIAWILAVIGVPSSFHELKEETRERKKFDPSEAEAAGKALGEAMMKASVDAGDFIRAWGEAVNKAIPMPPDHEKITRCESGKDKISSKDNFVEGSDGTSSVPATEKDEE